MNGESNLITYSVEGVSAESGHIRVDYLVDKLDNLLTALNDIDRIVGNTYQPTLYYRVVKVEHGSPLTITIQPVVRKRVSITDSPDQHIAIRHNRFFKELDAIRRNEPLSPEIDDRVVEHLRDLAEGSAGNLNARQFQIPKLVSNLTRLSKRTFEGCLTKRTVRMAESKGCWMR